MACCSRARLLARYVVVEGRLEDLHAFNHRMKGNLNPVAPTKHPAIMIHIVHAARYECLTVALLKKAIGGLW
jgi:hypothetical protein